MKRLRALTVLAFVFAGTARADAAEIVVSDVWSRPASATAVVYATLRNRAATPDRLVGAVSPAARSIGLHETFETSMPAASTSMKGMPMPPGRMTSMRSVAAIPIPARGTTSLSPGGYHLMLDLHHAIKAGDVIPLRLHFARAGWIVTSAHVRPIR